MILQFEQCVTHFNALPCHVESHPYALVHFIQIPFAKSVITITVTATIATTLQHPAITTGLVLMTWPLLCPPFQLCSYLFQLLLNLLLRLLLGLLR
jgi:hypothetical protein